MMEEEKEYIKDEIFDVDKNIQYYEMELKKSEDETIIKRYSTFLENLNKQKQILTNILNLIEKEYPE